MVKKIIRNLSSKNLIFYRIYAILKNYSLVVKKLVYINDKKFAYKKYKERTGSNLNLDNPTTFNEKLWWLKLNNRDPLLTICSDKVKVREYVKDCGLEHILVRCYGFYDNLEDINFNEFTDKVFIKCNHGSGTNAIYDNEKEFDFKKIRLKFKYALKQNYYLKSREWNYKDIQPKIIVEELLESKNNVDLIDYRFLCFDGKVKLIFVDIETAASDGSHNPHARRNVYDTNFKYLNVKVGRDQFDKNYISKPDNFDRMIEYAEILSKPFPHCRVDLYNVDGKIFFGEMTFYHGGGNQKIEPKEWDYKMGSWININSDKVKVLN